MTSISYRYYISMHNMSPKRSRPHTSTWTHIYKHWVKTGCKIVITLSSKYKEVPAHVGGRPLCGSICHGHSF